MLKICAGSQDFMERRNGGRVGTALLFTIGKQLLGLYLGKASVGSTYGAAGSFVAVVVWIYYSAQIFFFGAEFTRMRAEAHEAGRESAARERLVEAPSESGVKSQSLLQSEGAPMTMAASASAAGLGKPPAPAYVSASLDRPMPSPLTASADAGSLNERSGVGLTDPPATLGSRKTKPRLLMAAALGFVLGRVFGAISKNRSSHS
jgi:hypothetical protein